MKKKWEEIRAKKERKGKLNNEGDKRKKIKERNERKWRKILKQESLYERKR